MHVNIDNKNTLNSLLAQLAVSLRPSAMRLGLATRYGPSIRAHSTASPPDSSSPPELPSGNASPRIFTHCLPSVGIARTLARLTCSIGSYQTEYLGPMRLVPLGIYHISAPFSDTAPHGCLLLSYQSASILADGGEPAWTRAGV